MRPQQKRRECKCGRVIEPPPMDEEGAEQFVDFVGMMERYARIMEVPLREAARHFASLMMAAQDSGESSPVVDLFRSRRVM